MNQPLVATVRPLEGIEVAMAAMHQYQFGTTQATQCLYLSSDFTMEQISSSVRYLYSKFQFLRCSIIADEDSYYFQENVGLDDIEVLQYSVGHSQLDDLIYELCDRPLNQENSLWRIARIELEDINLIVMSVAHAIVDNEGMYTLAHEFLSCLDAIRCGNPLALPENNIVSKPINHYLKTKSDKPNVSFEFKKLEHKCVVARRERKTNSVLKQIDNASLDDIKSFANVAKIKMNSLLAASLCFASKNSPLDMSVIEFNTAISLRAVAQGEERNPPVLGCYIGVSSLPIDIHGCEDVVSLAKSYQKNLVNDIVKSRMEKLSVKRENVESFALRINESGEFIQGMGITNLGEVNIPENYSTFTIDNYFSIVNRTAGNLSVVLHCYEFRQKLYLNFVYANPLVEKTTIENLANSMVAILASLNEL